MRPTDPRREARFASLIGSGSRRPESGASYFPQNATLAGNDRDGDPGADDRCRQKSPAACEQRSSRNGSAPSQIAGFPRHVTVSADGGQTARPACNHAGSRHPPGVELDPDVAVLEHVKHARQSRPCLHVHVAHRNSSVKPSAPDVAAAASCGHFEICPVILRRRYCGEWS